LANDGGKRIGFSIAIAAIVVIVMSAIADIFGHDGMISCLDAFSNWYCAV
jgi:hypothetical protein